MDRHSGYVVAAGPIWARPAVLLPVFGLVAAVAGALPSFSLSSNVLVLSTGGTLFWFGVRREPVPEPSEELASRAVVWALPIGLFSVVELATFLYGSHRDYPTFSLLADPVLERYVPRSALFFGWLTAFWGLARR